jgi:hypothetical protein
MRPHRRESPWRAELRDAAPGNTGGHGLQNSPSTNGLSVLVARRLPNFRSRLLSERPASSEERLAASGLALGARVEIDCIAAAK